MLASITPLGERGRGSTWWVTATAFALGATAAAALAGAAAGALGSVLVPGALNPAPRLALLAVALAGAVAVEATTGAAPGPRRQVNERWLDEYRGWVYGLGFGAQLGLGVTTVVTSAATYVALLAAGLSARPAQGALIVGVYGAVRGLTPLLGARVRSSGQLLALHAALDRGREPSRRLAVLALAALAVVAAVGALG